MLEDPLKGFLLLGEEGFQDFAVEGHGQHRSGSIAVGDTIPSYHFSLLRPMGIRFCRNLAKTAPLNRGYLTQMKIIPLSLQRSTLHGEE
jgi:hypothetical protein